MSIRLCSVLALALSTTIAGQSVATVPATKAPATLTLENVIAGSVNLAPVWSERWSWASDGVHLLRVRGEERTWIDALTGAEVETPKDDKGDAIPKPNRPRLPRAENAEKKRPILPASLSGEQIAIEFATTSPNGEIMAYVRENDLFVNHIARDVELARTTDGTESQFNGKLDWVYQEEIYGRGKFQAFWWSPDSDRVAFLSLDESPVNTFTVIDHIETGHFRVKPEITHYPKSGDPNPIVRLGVLNAADGSTTWIDLSRYADSEPLVARVEWTPAGLLMYVVQDRLQTWADVCVWNPETNKSKVWIGERSNTWVDRPESPHWLDDGSFLWESNRTGYRHLYHYSAKGAFQQAVTAGDWQVTSVEDIDQKIGRIRFRSTEDGADERHAYTINLDGTNRVHLTPGKGQHRLRFNDQGTLAVDTFTALSNPGVAQLVDGLTGQVVRELATASSERWDATGVPQWRSLQVPTRDGLLLDGALLMPKLAPGVTTAPLWISTYSGPDAPTVRERWNSSSWFAFLASQGIAVFQMNVRTASGMGHWAIEQCYKHMGGQELADFEDALDWLAETQPWFDAEHVGMTGYSYGGFMTAYAMTHCERFALGIAGGGVYDWGLYDTIYTERYMSTPQLNPEGYAGTSVLNAAANLHGHLLIAHGVMDDNVHVQNAMQLIYKLQKAGKSFELMLYPQSRHGVRDKAQREFDRRMNWKAIQKHLLDR